MLPGSNRFATWHQRPPDTNRRPHMIFRRLTACSLLLVAFNTTASTKLCGQEPVGAEPISLFDGETLDGWVTLDGEPITHGWEVVDGTIHVIPAEKRPGHIRTTRSYENFVLEFEWRIAKGGNSGVKYLLKQSNSERGPGYFGCEYQLLDDKRHKNGRTPTKTAGALYDLFAPESEQKTLKPLDEFNRSRVVVDNGHIEHWLNGNKIVDVTIDSAAWREKIKASKFSSVENFAEGPGAIMLQEHLSEAWFRNLKLTPLPNVEEPAENLPRPSSKFDDFFDQPSPDFQLSNQLNYSAQDTGASEAIPRISCRFETDSSRTRILEKLTFQQESHFPHLTAEIDTFDRFNRGDQGVIVIHIFQLVDQPAVIHLTLTNLDVELFLLGVAKTNLIDIFHKVRKAAVGIGTQM